MLFATGCRLTVFVYAAVPTAAADTTPFSRCGELLLYAVVLGGFAEKKNGTYVYMYEINYTVYINSECFLYRRRVRGVLVPVCDWASRSSHRFSQVCGGGIEKERLTFPMIVSPGKWVIPV